MQFIQDGRRKQFVGGLSKLNLIVPSGLCADFLLVEAASKPVPYEGLSALLLSPVSRHDEVSNGRNPTHREDFTSRLNAAAKTQQQDD
jgi:hypothetical protein